MLKSFSTSKPTSNYSVGINSTVGINSILQHKHKCYFHDCYLISKFCTNKKCTLPLCEKCIPIHLKQHAKEQSIIGNQSIIPFSSAYDIATQNLQAIINSKRQLFSSVKQAISSTKKHIQDLIHKQFSSLEQQIFTAENQLKVVVQKFNKIQKGSLKTLIFYFSDQHTLLNNKTQLITLGDQTQFSNQLSLIFDRLKNTLASFAITNQHKPILRQQIHSQIPDKNTTLNSKPTRSNSIPTIIQNYPLKNYSSAFITNTNNNNNTNSSNNFLLSKVTPVQLQDKSKQNPNIKFKSSSDFSLLLKQQRTRLQSVRNKNLSFVQKLCPQNYLDNQYTKPQPKEQGLKPEPKEQGLKHASKSVDNFYFTIGGKNNLQEQKSNQTRPLQITNNYNNFINTKESPKKGQLMGSNSHQKLTRIKQKYIGQISLSKENIKTETKKLQNPSQAMTGSKYSLKNTPIQALRTTDNKQLKTKELENRILSREQIRVNIENRLNQRSISTTGMEKDKFQFSKPSNGQVNFSGRELFSDQIRHETLKQPFGNKEKIQEFTLNKNYHQKESYRQSINHQVGMSSIKRQYKAQPMEDTMNKPGSKKFFQDNPLKPRQTQADSKFDHAKYERSIRINQAQNNVSKMVENRHFDVQQQSKKARIIHRQNLRNQASKKDLLYEQAKQSIKISDPNSKFDPKGDSIKENSTKENLINEKKLQKSELLNLNNQKKLNSSSKRQLQRRFNYLYQAQQSQVKEFKTQEDYISK